MTGVRTVTSTANAVDMGTVGGTIDLQGVGGGNFTVSAGTGATLATVDDIAGGGANSLVVDAGNTGAGNVQVGDIGAADEVLNVSVDVGDNGNATFGSIDADGAVTVTNANQVIWNGTVGGVDAPISISASAANVNTGMVINADLTASGAVTLGTTAGDIDVTGVRTVTSTANAVDMGTVGGTIDLQGVGGGNFTVSAGTGAT
ncbi:MAG: hypothetical protein GY938_17800, partial [Ketobacter sp.]|nr:hypothetical protein [Ketobacter sp.]